MPNSRALGQGLIELRPRGRSGTGRALHCFVQDRRIVIVHAFLKKTRTTPGRDLTIALQRHAQAVGCELEIELVPKAG